MADVAVFHHAQGLTLGVRAVVDQLQAAGHSVTAPDLYDGLVFDTLDQGVAHAEQVGIATIIERGRLAAAELPREIIYIGFSLGVLPAQMLAQTRPGANGAVLCHACVPTAEFKAPWPPSVPVQVHAMDHDELFVAEGDLDAARDLVQTVEGAELFLYPGDQHLFADSSLPGYDEAAATLLTQRVHDFIAAAQR